MPEGPEVRHYAELIDRALGNRPLREVAARTRAAKAWLSEHPKVLVGRRVLAVRAHGKNLYGIIEGGYFFYSHLMMWGRWQILPSSEAGAPDRRERARLANDECTAILLSAPVFEIGEGHPYDCIEYLRALGPDTLPYDDAGPFDTAEFLRRLLSDENRERAIGVALLDQRIAAGIGNYLRAEILFHCRLNPFVRVADLSQDALSCLCDAVPAIAKRAYDCGGVTIDEEQQARVHEDAELSYPASADDPMRRGTQFFDAPICPALSAATQYGNCVRSRRSRAMMKMAAWRRRLKGRASFTSARPVRALKWRPVKRRAGRLKRHERFALCRIRTGCRAHRGHNQTPRKGALLGEYCLPLDDDDLALAARYFAGYLFSLRDQRVVNVGGAMLLASALAVTGQDEATLRRRLVETGDFGDAVYDYWPLSGSPTLTLKQVAAALEVLAETSGSKAKLVLVIELLRKAATPLEGKYLVKLLSGDLRAGLREGAVEDALARLFQTDVPRVQWGNMLTGDIGETAVLARHGRLGEARMRLFHPLKFMLATPAADLTEVARLMPEHFFVEDKYDGIRAQAHIGLDDGSPSAHGTNITDRRVALFSRTMDEITGAFPDLSPALAQLLPAGAEGFIFDGEIVPLRGEQIGPFQDLQKRLGRKTPSPEIQLAVPVAFIVYDALYGPDRVRLADAFSTRREWLESLPFDDGRVRLAPSQVFDSVAPLDDEFDAARQRGNEGLMVKAPGSTYKPGKRGRDWLKIKRAIATLDVVVTAVEVGNGRRSKVLSDYTFAVRAGDDDDTLLNVGKAYSGLTDAEIAELSEWFRAHTIQKFAHGKVRTVEPQVVIEVTFDRVQASARHKSGYALRFPRILRLRPDKPVSEIDTLETVRKLADSES